MEKVQLPINLRALNHELRIPLTGILGSAYLLKDEPNSGRQLSYIDDILASGERLLEVINTILAKSSQINEKDMS